jgi:hypothetical protein
MLPTIASLIDEGLRDGREHYATLLEARPKPYVLDDATIERTKRVNRLGAPVARLRGWARADRVLAEGVGALLEAPVDRLREPGACERPAELAA